MYCKSANVRFCKPALTFWELRVVLTEEMYRNVYWVVVLVQLLRGREGVGWKGTCLEKLHSAECEMLRC